MKFLPAPTFIPKPFTLTIEPNVTVAEQLEVVPPVFAVSGTHNLLSVLKGDQLNLERVSLFLAAVKALLIPPGKLNGRFTHIYRNCLGWVGIGEQMLFSRQSELTRANQGRFHPLHGAAECGFCHAPILSNMEIGAILSPIL